MPRRTFLVATVLGVLLLSFVPAGTASPAAEPRTVTYPGSGLQVHLGEVGKLDETSPGFRRFVHDRLLRLWKLAGGSQKCRPAPTVIVKTWMSDGFARVGEGIYDAVPGWRLQPAVPGPQREVARAGRPREPGGPLLLDDALVRHPTAGGRPRVLPRRG